MKTVILLLTAFLVACSSSVEGDRNTLDNIPKVVAMTIRQSAGSAQIQVKEEHDKTGDFYEATWMADGTRHEAKVDATGKLVELEVDVALENVPVPVREAAAKALVGATHIKFVRIVTGSYQAEAVIDGKEREIEVDASGNLQRGDDDGDDDGEEDD